LLKEKMKEQVSTLEQMEDTIEMLTKNMEKMQKIIEINQTMHSSRGGGLNLPLHL
jgi:hypothetical protein